MEHSARIITSRKASLANGSRDTGVSADSVRRWINSGRFRAERAVRGRSSVRIVRLPIATAEAGPFDGHACAIAPDPSVEAEAARPSPPPAPCLHELAPITAILQHQAETIARLVADLTEVRAASGRQVEQLACQSQTIAELREDRGRLTAELETIAAEAMTAKIQERRLADELAAMRAEQARYTEIILRHAATRQSPPEPPMVAAPLWQHWMWVGVVTVAILVTVALLVLMLLDQAPFPMPEL